MIISRNFLNNNIKNLNLISTQQLNEAIHQLGYEVENLNFQIKNVDQSKFCFGKILKITKVLGAKRLNLVIVKTKSKNLQIICSATNLKINYYVIVALTNAKLANNLIIKPKLIFKIKSSEMICSYQELGIKNDNLQDHEIILLQFKNEAILNQKNILTFLNLNDQIWNIFLPQNRFYALSYFQFIKDIACYFQLEYLCLHDLLQQEKKTKLILNPYQIETKIKNLKFAFCEYNFLNLLNKHLDLNLKHFLLNQNFFNDNLILNFLNYAMMFLGQGLIFVDLTNKNINNFSFKYLHQQLVFGYYAKNNKFVIINKIGSYKNSVFNITSNCQKLLVISFCLNNQDIFKLRSHVNDYDWYLQRILNFKTSFYLIQILELIKNLFISHNILKSSTSIQQNFSSARLTKKILISANYVNKMLNTNFKVIDIQNLLKQFLFKTEIKKNSLLVFVNNDRWMLNSKSTILEEIIKIYGIKNIASSFNQASLDNTLANYNFHWSKIMKKIEDYLLSNHFFQVKTYSLISKNVNQVNNFFNYSNLVQLQTSYLQNHQVLRRSLLPSLFAVYIENKKSHKLNVKLFEINSISFQNKQNWHLAVIFEDNCFEIKDLNIYSANNIFTLKQILFDLLKILNFKFNLTNIKFSKLNFHFFNQYQSARIFYDQQLIGVIGEINLNLIKLRSKKVAVFGLELNLSKIIEDMKIKAHFLKLSFYNPIIKDMTMIVDHNFSYLKLIENNFKNIHYLQKINLKNYFKLNEKQVALTLSLHFNELEFQLKESNLKNSLNTIFDNLNKNNIKIK